jgi:hypothetical protein
MERTFPTKTLVLAANTQGTMSWGPTDFGPRFNESIIKKNVSIRFTCTNSGVSSVNVGMRYDTITKTYQVAERQTLFVIPAGKSIEITPATKPALGFLNDWILAIYLDMISASAANVQVAMIIDDEPPTLTADPGELIGLDQRLNSDYLTVNMPANQICNGGTNSTLVNYTVPSGKRFILDLLTGYIPPTPSFPELITWTAYLPVPNLSVFHTSFTEIGNSFIALQNSGYIFSAGEQIKVDAFNADTTAYTVAAFMIGREIY